jgi:hypothetical protein
MLRRVALVEQWRRILADLPEDWAEARIRLTVADAGRCDRAASLLGPAAPLRSGAELNFEAHRAAGFPGAEHVRRLLRKLDGERIGGTLELVAAEAAPAATDVEPDAVAPASLETAWADELAALPEDWSDLYVEVELQSSDYLERAALDLAPVNPASFGDSQLLRFRVARRFGYGASPEMVRACLGRCERDGIRGAVRVLRALSDTRPVATQGPVWYAGGRAI